MQKTTSRTQLVAGILAMAVLFALVLHGSSAPRAAVTGASATSEELVAGVRRPTSSTDGAYRAALGVWDGAMMAGNDTDAARWLTAGLLISRGEYPAARRQLQDILETAPPDSPLRLKTELLLAGTSGGRKLIALAFDDFPFPTHTPQLLDQLAQAHVPVTFFAIGHKVKEYPDVVVLALTQGHSIQNHTYHHVRLVDMTADQVREELNLCSRTIRDFTGVTPRYLRAPHAASNATVDREARGCGLTCIDPIVTNVYDMTANSDTVYQRCLQRAKPGAILALHDGLPGTIEAMPRVIAALRAKGYEFVTVDQLLGGGSQVAQAAVPGPVSAMTALLGGWLPPVAYAQESDPDLLAIR